MRIHDYAPLNLLRGRLPGAGSPSAFIHRCSSREVWRRRGMLIGLDLVLACLVWPVITLASAGLYTWRNGPAIRARTGRGSLRQMFEQLHLATIHAIPPCWYYVFELHDDDRRRRASQYLHRFEIKGGMYTMLKDARRSGALLSPLADKVAFASRCRERCAAVRAASAGTSGSEPARVAPWSSSARCS